MFEEVEGDHAFGNVHKGGESLVSDGDVQGFDIIVIASRYRLSFD